MSSTVPYTKKPFASSILLWVRTDQPRQTGMDYWKGPPALANTGVMTELRSQVFMPWNEKLWDTPNVAYDNPADQRFHASLFLCFKDAAARAAFFDSAKITTLSDELSMFASAVHAYDVSAALTYVTNGDILPHYQE
jgi:hypothetical protein